jgi:signal transduction histidine kinase
LDEEQRSDFLERIRRNARSLGVLIEDLLDTARLERSATSLLLQPVDLSDLVPKVVDQMSSLIGERPVAVAITPDVVAIADPPSVERILVNLLSNAAKYTPVGTDLAVTLSDECGFAVLSVADRGPGIAPTDRERIFDRFYRVDNAAGRASRGVGIGLALVRQLAELLHGTITADETPGGGARFTLAIPLAEDSALSPSPAWRQLDVQPS